MNVELTLAENLKKLMEVHSLKPQNLHDKAAVQGISLHKSTIKDVTSGEKSWRSDLLNKLGDIFSTPPAFLLWPNGLDDKGQPKGVNLSINHEHIKWAYKRIDLMCDELEIDDLEFKAKAFDQCVTTAALDGIERADIEFLKLLKDYNN